ncbi:hypothetical protein D9M72_509700 [compost metagenome]
MRLFSSACIAKVFWKTVAKFESVKGDGMARPSSARALNGAKTNQTSGSAKTVPRKVAAAAKTVRRTKMF